MSPEIREQLKHLPTAPGIYQYFDVEDKLLYIGKAKNLNKRVHSYWQKEHQSPWTDLLVADIHHIKWIEVKTELEALMLENSLVKSLKPKYNIQLKDDKTFPFIRVSNEKFPTFTITRKLKNDKARYLGPFVSATYIRTMLKLLQGLYGVKTVNEKSYESRSSVPQQIGLGSKNLDNEASYRENVEQAIKFLSSPQPKMEKIISSQMAEAADNEEFERAVILRDRLQALQQLRSAQSLFGTSYESRDYIGIAYAGNLLSVYIFQEREGKITGHYDYIFEVNTTEPKEEQLYGLLSYLYIQGLIPPKTLVLPYLPANSTNIKELLQEQFGRVVDVHVPSRGDQRYRLTTAEDNAQYQLKLEAMKKDRRKAGLDGLQKILGLNKTPKRIEAFDISNLGASTIVGASIVFINGQPAKNEYRKYIIETPQGQDDFASMRELVFRRVSNKSRPLPDLLLIDGGKGQLNAALDALKLANQELPIFSLAKKEELIFLPNRAEPISLAQDNASLLLITAIRDEVHRFVISFHRQRRKKKLLP